MLAELGAGFDCASTAEVAAVLALGVEPDRIVFANPCKRPNDIKCVAQAILHCCNLRHMLLRLYPMCSNMFLRIRILHLTLLHI